MKRLISGLAVLAACLVTLATVSLAPANAAPTRNPVVFLHGYGGAASDVGSVKPGLIARGYVDSDIHSLDFPNGETNDATAARLKTYVDQLLAATGASKVDLIGFSMGSLSSRYYLKNLGGTARVAHFASIAGPNHGTSQASLCWIVTSDKACPQMAPGSTFLTNLNAGDETPGDVGYATWVSHCDDVISPPESTILAGAVNTWTDACLAHNQTPSNAQVVNGIADLFLAATPPPPPPTSTNLALNKPATGSAACTSTEGPAKAVNGSVTGGNADKFCSAGSAGWLRVDLGATRSLTGFTVKHAQAGGEPATYNTRAFTIAVSTDGTTWTTVTTVTANTAGVSTHPVATTARYVRLNVTASVQPGAPWPASRIYELEVTGS